MTDPNIHYSGLSREVVLDWFAFRIEIYLLEPELEWSLEVVDEAGASTVWDDLLTSNRDALDGVLKSYKNGGVSAFCERGNVVSFAN